jgi:hypothetical protein
MAPTEDILVNTSKPLRQPNSGCFAMEAAGEFLREYWLRFVTISAVVLIPCVWHHHLEAGDLPSHLYNAWLAQLIAKGQAPGLFLAPQWNNVLFDFALSGFGNLVGLDAAEKIAVCATVLIFFWGSFALACNVSHTASLKTIPWFLLPCLAVFAYGYTFQMGFMNYYVSIGLAFFCLALLARSDVRSTRSVLREGRVALFLIPLIWLAHPMGLFVLVSAGAYILLAKRLPPGRHVYLFSLAVLILLALHFYIKFRHWDIHWKADSAGLMVDGADQLMLYAPHYLLPVYLLKALFLTCLMVDAAGGWRTPRWRQSCLLPVQLYGLALLAICLLPSKMVVPHRFGTMDAIGFLSERLTSVAAIFACCLLGQIKPQKWHYAVFAAVAAMFFSYLYWDTAAIGRMEDQVERCVRSLPLGQRVIMKGWYLPGNRVSIDHIIDRACIGRCFSYANYEPALGQFRIRVQSENPFVLPTGVIDDAVAKGEYVVQQRDLPLSEIYQCNPGTTALCIRALEAGQKTEASIHPVRSNDSSDPGTRFRIGTESGGRSAVIPR